jgi:hypothetical protein
LALNQIWVVEQQAGGSVAAAAQSIENTEQTWQNVG